MIFHSYVSLPESKPNKKHHFFRTVLCHCHLPCIHMKTWVDFTSPLRIKLLVVPGCYGGPLIRSLRLSAYKQKSYRASTPSTYLYNLNILKPTWFKVFGPHLDHIVTYKPARFVGYSLVIHMTSLSSKMAFFIVEMVE